jgi:hypothetical protein
MHILGTVLLSLLGLFLLVLALVLFLPIHIGVSLSNEDRRLRMAWFGIRVESDWVARQTHWRLWFWRLPSGQWKAAETPPGREVRKKGREERDKKVRRRVEWWDALDLLPLVARVAMRFLRDLLRPVRLEYLDGQATIATPDPALTGALYGLSHAVIAPFVGERSRITLRTGADFSRGVPRFSLRASLHYRLFGVAQAFWHAFWALPKRRIFRLVRGSKGARGQGVQGIKVQGSRGPGVRGFKRRDRSLEQSVHLRD